jgi:transcriptional regulator with XRE-family HTH domain
MDTKWFKDKQKEAGVTAEDIAKRAGRARSNVSHIYAGKQKMSLEWAQAFADTLNVPIDEVLKRAGAISEPRAQQINPGFSESDAAPFAGKAPEQQRAANRAQTFGGDRPGVDIWTVRSNALALNGYLPGDQILVDTHQSETCRAGDVVVAQKYDWQTGSATTLLRRFEPPVLVAASLEPDDQRIDVVDGTNVIIKGKIIASWRSRAN